MYARKLYIDIKTRRADSNGSYYKHFYFPLSKQPVETSNIQFTEAVMYIF